MKKNDSFCTVKSVKEKTAKFKCLNRNLWQDNNANITRYLKNIQVILVVILITLIGSSTAIAENIPNIFTNGAPIDANKINENLAWLMNREAVSFYAFKPNLYYSTPNGESQITWEDKKFDNAGFDLAVNQFKPRIAGKYHIDLQMTHGDSSCTWHLMLLKNGAPIIATSHLGYGQPQTLSISVVVDANGINDYFEAHVHNCGHNIIGTNNGNRTFISGFLIR